MTKGIKVVVSYCISPENISLAIFPKINGTTIKKEKRAAFSLSIPNSTAVEIVAPDREIPGKMAIACEIPIRIACLIPTFFADAFALSARNNNNPVTKSILPTSVKAPPKRASISSLKNTPTKVAGIIERTIFNENQKESLFLNCNNPLRISRISFRKIIIVESAVAKCSTTVIRRLSSPTLFSPKMAFAISKCPLLLTGKNSVSP